MSWLSDLFSGGSQEQTNELPADVKSWYKDSADAYKSYWRYSMGLPQNSQYDAEARTLAANALDPEQRAGLEGILANAGRDRGLGGGVDAIAALFRNGGLNGRQGDLAQLLTSGAYRNPAQATVDRIASGAENGKNPYLDATYRRAAESFREAAVPAMDSRFAAAGRTGSGAYAAALGKQMNEGLGQLATSIYGGGYAQDRQNQMAALGQQAGLGQQDVQNALSGAGLYDQGVQRQMQGIGLGQGAYDLSNAQNASRYNAATQIRNAPLASAQQSLSTVTGNLGGQGQTTATSQQNPLTGAIGTIGSIAGLAALFASDERLKRKKKKVGTLPIYDWEYKDRPGEVHRGPMAQDLEKVQPDKVSTDGRGVRYIPAAMVS